MANSNILDEILVSPEPDTSPDVAPAATQPPSTPLAPGVGGGPTGRGDTIKVQVEGIPAPLEFEPGTSPEVIQSVVKRVTSQQPQQDGNLPHVPEGMAAAGAAGGAMFGTTMGGPPGAAIGALAGGAGGHMLGKTLQDLSNGVEQNLDRISSNALEASKMGLVSGAFEGLGGVIGKHIVDPMIRGSFGAAGAWIGSKLFVPKVISPTVANAEKVLTDAGAPGLTAGQLGAPKDKRLGTILESIVYNSLTTNVLQKIRGRQQDGLKDYAANIMEQLNTLPAKESGELFKWLIDTRFDRLVRAPMNVAMTEVRNAAPGNIVNITPVMRLLHKDTAMMSTVQRELKNEFDVDPQLYQKLLDLTAPRTSAASTQALPALSLDEAMRLKTAFEQFSRQRFSNDSGQQLAASAGVYAKRINGQIEQALQGVPQALSTYQTGMKDYAAGMEFFNREITQKFLDKLTHEPGELANLVLKPGQVEFVSHLKELAGDAWWKTIVEPRVGATIMYRAFGQLNKAGRLDIEGSLSGAGLAKTLQKLATDGTAQTIFSQKLYTQLLDFAKAVEHVKPTPGGTGGVYIQLAQSGAVGAVIGGAGGYLYGSDAKSAGFGAAIGAPVVILLGPKMLGPLIAEPKYMDAFKHGLLETKRTGKPTTRLLDVIKHLGAQEGVKGLLTEPTAPTSDPTLNQRPNIFKRQPVPTSSTAAAKPSGLTTE